MKSLSKSRGRKVKFAMSSEPGNEVFISGSFNNWNPTEYPMADSSKRGEYKSVIKLSAGTHEYKFIVNGVWMEDPNCSNWVKDGHGSVNSILDV